MGSGIPNNLERLDEMMTTATKMIRAYATFKIVGDEYRVWVEAPAAGTTGCFGYAFPLRAGYDALYTRIDVLCRQNDWELSRFTWVSS